MAITLTAAAGVGDVTLKVSGPYPGLIPNIPNPAVIDAEVVNVYGSGLVWLVQRGFANTSPAAHASGAVVTPYIIAPASKALGPAGVFAETMPRETCPEVDTTVSTTGQIFDQAIWLTAGQKVSNITMCTGATAAGTPTHYALAVTDNLGNTLGSTADQTTTAWAANTVKTIALSTPFVASYSGVYYVAFMVVATTVPTIKGGTGRVNGALSVAPPIISGVSATTYTTGAAPATIALPTGAVLTSIYAGLS